MSRLEASFLNLEDALGNNREGRGEGFTFRVRAVPSFALIFAGSMDCLTTVIGILFFGAVESNPFLSSMTSANLLLFTIMKLTSTLFVGAMFHQANKVLNQTEDKSTKSFKRTRSMLRGAYVGATCILLIAVANNVVTLARIT